MKKPKNTKSKLSMRARIFGTAYSVVREFIGYDRPVPKQMQINIMQKEVLPQAEAARSAPQEISIEQKVEKYYEIFTTDPAMRTEAENRLMKELGPDVNEYYERELLGKFDTDNVIYDNNLRAMPDDEPSFEIMKNTDDSKYQLNSIALVDEAGEEHGYEITVIFDVENDEYAALIPLDEQSEDVKDKIFIMRYVFDEDGTETFFHIENEEEWGKVTAAYKKMIQELEEEDV